MNVVTGTITQTVLTTAGGPVLKEVLSAILKLSTPFAAISAGLLTKKLWSNMAQGFILYFKAPGTKQAEDTDKTGTRQVLLENYTSSLFPMTNEAAARFSHIGTQDNTCINAAESDKNQTPQVVIDSPGDFDPDGGNSALISSSSDEVKEPPMEKNRKKLELKNLFKFFNFFGSFAFFIPSRPFTPISVIIVTLLSVLAPAGKIFGVFLNVFIPVARTVSIFDSIRFLIQNGSTFLSLLIDRNTKISYFMIIQFVGFLIFLGSLSLKDFYQKRERNYLQVFPIFFISAYYTFYAKNVPKDPFSSFVVFLCFFASISQLHLLTTNGKDSIFKGFLNLVSPFSK